MYTRADEEAEERKLDAPSEAAEEDIRILVPVIPGSAAEVDAQMKTGLQGPQGLTGQQGLQGP